MREFDPEKTPRAERFKLFGKAPMPMVTVFKTLDVTRLVHISKRGYKFNMLMCYCIGLSASKIPEFKWLPVGEKMYEYDSVGVCAIVKNKNGGINSCEMTFTDKLNDFNRTYLELTSRVQNSCKDISAPDSMVIGTSCVAQYDIDGVVNMYSGIFNNPCLFWGRLSRKGFFKRELKLSFQFHHVQMDGGEACAFLDGLQKAINEFRE